jgi:hypothetical protein
MTDILSSNTDLTNFLSVQLKLQNIFLAIMVSYQSLTSMLTLKPKQDLLLVVRPFLSKTLSRITRLKYQDMLVTCP